MEQEQLDAENDKYEMYRQLHDVCSKLQRESAKLSKYHKYMLYHNEQIVEMINTSEKVQRNLMQASSIKPKSSFTHS